MKCFELYVVLKQKYQFYYEFKMIRADSRVNLNHTPIRTKAEWTQKSQRTKNYSRQAILEWINQLLKLELSSLEQLGTGAVYCQIVDIIYPDVIQMGKVNWQAKNEGEFLKNLKILQGAFDKVGVRCYLDVGKLCKAKQKDNLEFIQWLMRHYQSKISQGREYNVEKRRGQVKVDLNIKQKQANKRKNSILLMHSGSNFSLTSCPIQRNSSSYHSSNDSPNKDQYSTKQSEKSTIFNRQFLFDKDGVKQLKRQAIEMEVKLGMIRQIIESTESAEVKIELMEELIQMNLNDYDF